MRSSSVAALLLLVAVAGCGAGDLRHDPGRVAKLTGATSCRATIAGNHRQAFVCSGPARRCRFVLVTNKQVDSTVGAGRGICP